MNNGNTLKFNALERSRNDLFKKLDKLQPEVFTYKSSNEKWSINQVIYHLLKSEQLTSIAINRKLAQKGKLVKAGLGAVIRSKILNTALKTKLKFKAPQITTTLSDELDIMELKKKWEAIRATYKQIIENFPADYSDREIFKHPRAGSLNMNQTLEFLQNHFYHHNVQIENLIIQYFNK